MNKPMLASYLVRKYPDIEWTVQGNYYRGTLGDKFIGFKLDGPLSGWIQKSQIAHMVEELRAKQ